jgi:hypothetical protein
MVETPNCGIGQQLSIGVLRMGLLGWCPAPVCSSVMRGEYCCQLGGEGGEAGGVGVVAAGELS